MRRKNFLHEAREAPEGDAEESKIENPKIENRKNGKNENRRFWILLKKAETPKIQWIARTAFKPLRKGCKSLPLGRILIPPLPASYLL
jgi:hypothetical protein